MADQRQHEPATLTELEHLIKNLYAPAADVSRIQTMLQTYQRSEQGWLFADQLLQNQDPHVRFFGALTFTIKINNDWETLSTEDTTALLNRLLSLLVHLTNASDGPLVLRKLCSTLVAYFLQPTVHWDSCVRQLVCCMNVGDVVPQEALVSMPPTVNLLPTLSTLKIKVVLWFAATLVEEVGKTDPSSAQTHRYHEKLSFTLDDTVVIIQTLLSPSNVNPEVAEEAMKCLQPWITYAYRANINKGFTHGLKILRSLLPLLLNCLSVEALFEVSLEFFTDVLVSFPAFLQASHLASLATVFSDASAQEWVSALRSGESGEDALDFSRLLFAYGDASVQELAQNTNSPAQAQVARQLVQLVNCEGYEPTEMQICSQAIEFWGTFTEHIIDELFEEEVEPQWVNAAKSYLMNALEQGWAKIRLPSQDVVAAWSSDSKTDFRTLRRDLQDLVQASHVLLGLSIFETFTRLALSALDRHAWSDVEAALYCLNALSDSTATTSTIDDFLSEIFSSQLFAGSTITSGQVPVHTQQTALDTLANYTPFFERQYKYLPSTLTYLFQCLERPALASTAAKAIFFTCVSCHGRLVDEVSSFLSAYRLVQHKDAAVKEKVIGAIVMIIGGIPQTDRQLGPLSELLVYVEQDAASSQMAVENRDLEGAVATGLCALRCLVSMGKALELPDETIVDLEADPKASNPDREKWNLSEGAELKSRVVRLLQTITSSLHFDNDIMEAACQVLRTGYKETQPGLFVLLPSVTVGLAVFGFRSGFDSPKLNHFLDAAATMLSRRDYATADDMNSAAASLLHMVLDYIRARNNDPRNDPEAAASCINLVNNMIPEYITTLFSPEIISVIPALVDFSFRCLANPDLMPKRAAASFWTSLLHRHDLPPALKVLLTQLNAQFGQQLANILVRSIAGEAARSELETMAEPLRKMVFAQLKAATWIHTALFDPGVFPCPLPTPQKEQWFNQVMRLRGAKGTNTLVKDFWMACRGTSGAWTS